MSVMSFIATLVNTLAWPIVVLVLGFIFRHQVAQLMHNLAERVKHLTKLQTPAGSAEFDNQLIAVKEDIAPIVRSQNDVQSSTASASGVDETATEAESDDESQKLLRHYSAHSVVDRWESLDNINPEFGDWISADRIVPHTDLREMQQESPEAMISGAFNRLEVTVDLVAFDLKINVKSHGFLWIALAVLDQLHRRKVLKDAVSTAAVITRLEQMRNSVVSSSGDITKLQAYEYAVSAWQISNLLIDAYNRLPTKNNPWEASRVKGDEDSSPSS
jgi:hypothetical protein